MMGESKRPISAKAPVRGFGLKESFILLIFLSAVISLTNSAKLSRSNHHDSRKGGDDAGGSSLETLLLRDKLNLILDAESREVTLLKNLLDESREKQREAEEEAEEEVASSSSSGANVGKSVEKNELGKSYKSQSDSWTTATSPTTTTTSPTSTSTTLPPVEKVGRKEKNVPSLEYIREQGVVNKLEENSRRMEKMIVFLVDLRNLLTEALTSQNRQMTSESELVEIREEMEYLRKELQTLKKERRTPPSPSSAQSEAVFGGNNVNLENKLHNEEATIEWLKESTNGLRKQMEEISESCNITVMVQMKEQMDKENGRRSADLAAAEKELEALRLKQLRQDEQIYEAKANIEDLRSWQVKMGKRFIESKSTATDTLSPRSHHDEPNSESDDAVGEDEESKEERSNSIEFGEEHFITEALKESVGKPMRHSNKRLKAKVHELQTIIQDLVKDNKNYHRRLMKIESSQRSLKSLTNNLRETLSQAGLISGGGGSNLNNEIQRSGSNTNVNTNNNNNNNNNGGRLSKRMASLEKTMQEYVITLENLNDKVGAVEELQESSTQLFRSLETLETKYDERVTELQTGLARLESSVSSMNVVNEDLKEQQTQQSALMQNVKKELFQVKGKLQTNHLRLASIQSQMVKWASQKCSDESSESIQNIRIATLEHALLDLKETPSVTSTTDNNY